MRRLIIAVAVLALAGSTVACGSADEEGDDQSEAGQAGQEKGEEEGDDE